MIYVCIHTSCPGFHFLILPGYCEWEANTFQTVSNNTIIIGLLFIFFVLLSTFCCLFCCYLLTHNTHEQDCCILWASYNLHFVEKLD